MGFVLGFLPWVLYWALIGNVPFRLAAVLVLAVAIAVQVLGRLRRRPWRSLEVGSLAVFALLALAAFVVDDDVLARWMQPLSNLGIFLVALGGLPSAGRSCGSTPRRRSTNAPPAPTASPRITRDMTVLWVGVFAAMTVVSAIPPFVDGDATLRDSDDLLSILCYWVIPYVLLALAGLVSGFFPPWFEKRSALVEQREAEESAAACRATIRPPDLADAPLALDLPAVPAGTTSRSPWSCGACPPGLTVSRRASAATTCSAGPGESDARLAAPAIGRGRPRHGRPRRRATGCGPLDGRPDQRDALRRARRHPGAVRAAAAPWRVTVEVSVDGGATVRRTVERVAGVERRTSERVARSTGDRGLLVLPPGDAPPGGWPAVACFGGSEGGFDSQVGQRRDCWPRTGSPRSPRAGSARRRRPRRSPRFRSSGSPARSACSPTGRRSTRAGSRRWRVSRGAEGCSRVLTVDPAAPCRGLVLVSPSSMSWQAIGADGEIPDTPSWTHAGRPVPWRPVQSGELMGQLVRNAWRIGRDRAAHRPTLLRLRAAYCGRPRPRHGRDARRGAVRPSVAPAQRHRRRRVAGGADGRGDPRQTGGGRRPDRHVRFAGAGHLVRLGAFPTDAQWTGGIALGGEREGQAAAQRAAITEVTRFLADVTALVPDRAVAR